MFDIGFTEILVIAVIALFVIGPDRLPQTVREISLWIGRLKRSLRDTRQELEQQLGADEIRRTLHNENVMHSLQNIKRDVEDTLNKEIRDDDEEEDYELPPHDPNNDIDDEDQQAQTQQDNKTETAMITADALARGDIPFASAAEEAAARVEKEKDKKVSDANNIPSQSDTDSENSAVDSDQNSNRSA